MTLNASGPISLGGSTVGQSINLELGNSATALASINSTPFRTLAGVPSGAIALNNFYGKSNASSWVLYLGQGQPNLTVSASIGTVCFGNYRWAAGRNSGVVAMGVNGRSAANLTFGIKWISSAGVASNNVFNGNAGGSGADPAGLAPMYSASSDVFYVAGNDQRYFNTVNANGTTYNGGGSFNGLTSSDPPYINRGFGSCACTDSSGNTVIVFHSDSKTFGSRILVGKFSSNTTYLSGLYSSYNNGFGYVNSIYPRSDGTFVAFGAGGTTAPDTGRAVFFNSAISAVTATYAINNYASTNQFYTASAYDNVNNVSYMRGAVGGNVTIARFDSSFNCTAQVQYYDTTDNFNMQGDGVSISYYGGYLYLVGTLAVAPSYFVVCQLNPTTLAVNWSYKFTIGNSKVFQQPGSSYQNVVATANGIYCFYYLASTNECYLFNISGASAPTPKTVNLPSAAGGTYSLTISAVTVTATSLSNWTRTTPSASYGTVGAFGFGYGLTTSTVTNGVSSTLVSF